MMAFSTTSTTHLLNIYQVYTALIILALPLEIHSTEICTNTTSLDPQTRQISLVGMQCQFHTIYQERWHIPVTVVKLYLECNAHDGSQVGAYVRDYLLAPHSLQELTLYRCSGLVIAEYDFANLTSLEILTINYSYLNLLHPRAFRQLSNLRHLNMNHLDITKLPEALMADFSNSIQEITHKNGDHVPFLNNLKALDLSGNQISTLPIKAFVNCQQLEMLDLSYNHLNKLQRETFEPLNNLLVLKINSNPFTEIPQHFWVNFPLLDTLDLTHSAMSSFNNQTFDGLSNLITLEVSGQLNHIEANAFQQIAQVEEIIISAEFLKSVPQDLFHNMNSLHKIQLNGGLFPILLPLNQLFQNLSNLESITAERNHIDTIHDMSLYGSGRHLKAFNFANNNISSIAASFISREMPHVEVINLHNNNLNNITRGTFRHLVNLQEVDLSFNNLGYLQSHAFEYLPQLIKLNFSNNRLTTIRVDALYVIPQLKMLDLSSNRFTNFQPVCGSSMTCGSDVGVDMRMNPLRCDSDMLLFLGNLESDLPVLTWPYSHNLANQRFINHEQLLCSGPGNILAYIYSTEYHCPWKKDQLCYKVANLILDESNFFNEIRCPIPCHCYLQVNFQENFAMCDSNNLTTLPDFAIVPDLEVIFLYNNWLEELYIDSFMDLSNLKTLGLHHNKLRAITPGVFNGLARLEVLTLYNNWLGELYTDSFMELSKLKTLDLHNNRLRTIPPGVFNGLAKLEVLFLNHNMLYKLHIDSFKGLSHLTNLTLQNNILWSIKEGVFHGLTSLVNIKLRGNPLQCNCSHLWLKTWLQDISDHGIVDEVNCTTPKNITGSLLFFEDADFMCPTSFSIVTIVAICLGLLLTLALLSGIVVFFKTEIQVITYSYFNIRLTLDKDQNEVDKVYDAFISYSSEDYQYVVFDLLKKLEEQHPPYKLCIHQRDFQVGEAIADNIVGAIESSKRTIVVLSENYLNSEWCLYEFKVAHRQFLHDHKNRLIVIRMEEVAKEKMDKDMRAFVSMNTYLERNDPLFLKRIMYALPDPRPPQPPPDSEQVNLEDMEIGGGEGGDSDDINLI